ncbi:MAG: hypothetical protein RQ952_05710 [Thermoproteota archaeon]|jgi:hypothetical protein|nr:hypothetical protein [Thermoproteota archaeon]
MKAIKVEKEAWDLFFELLDDLANNNLSYMNRYPEPVGEMRYRDVLKKAFLDTGKCLAIIWLIFENGLKKTYSFLIEADIEEGEFSNIAALPGKVRANVIEELGDEKTIKIYRESKFSNGNEIVRYLELVGNKYRERELYITMKNALKEELF